MIPLLGEIEEHSWRELFEGLAKKFFRSTRGPSETITGYISDIVPLPETATPAIQFFLSVTIIVLGAIAISKMKKNAIGIALIGAGLIFLTGTFFPSGGLPW